MINVTASLAASSAARSSARPKTRRDVFRLAGAAAAAGLLVPRVARAVETVDLLLSLSADVSRSVDDEKFRLQRNGYANAIADPRILSLIGGGPTKRIAVNFIEWADAGSVSVMVPWTTISNADEARAFAAHIVAAPRYYRGRTSISTGIDFAAASTAAAPYGSERRVIDISGDGTHNSGRSVQIARDEAIASGITINAIAILSAVPLAFNPSHTHPPGGLLKYFEDNVIGGNGAFAIAAEGFGDFGQAIVQKLIKEIAATPAPRPSAMSPT